MLKKILQLWLLAIFMVAVTPLWAAADKNDPVQLLSSVADQMIGALNEQKVTLKTNPAVVYSLANKIIVPHADLDEMSQRVLPPNVWQQSTPAQRKQFQHEFTNVLVRTYASALASYSDQTIKFYPVRGGAAGKSRVQVDSNILQSNGPAIAVSYFVIRRGNIWKLYDMNVEGVSMLQSFRSQFADQLVRGNMEDLIKALTRHNQQKANVAPD